MQVWPRGAARSQVVEDHVDEVLLERLKKITMVGATDGCAAPIKSVQLLRERHLPNLRYQFRDRPHTTRTCVKGVLKYMAEGRALLEALITNKGSFAKKARYSRRFQQIWVRKQVQALAVAQASGAQASGALPGTEDDLLVALRDLCYAEQRFDSRSSPMSILCSRFGCVVQVLREISLDTHAAHQADAKWAKSLIALSSGPVFVCAAF